MPAARQFRLHRRAEDLRRLIGQERTPARLARLKSDLADTLRVLGPPRATVDVSRFQAVPPAMSILD